MNFKLIPLSFVLSLIGIPVAQAYPWTSFRQHKSNKILELDIHASYFTKGQAVIFSGAGFNYHNPSIDINLGWTFSFSEKANYFRVSELALIFPLTFKDWTMSLGFKDVLWSSADRYWNYGLWQARYMLDAFRPVQMGLPGLYFNYKGSTSLLFLASYFFIPDVTVYPKLQEKKVTSKNPFFLEPFRGGVQWNINKLNLFQINRFFKPTVAIQIKHNLQNSHVVFAYAYKPVNQLQYLPLIQGINLSDETSDSFTITDFNYSVLSHHLLSFEGEVALGKGFSLLTSLFYEKPEKLNQKQSLRNRITDESEPHLTFSVLSYFEESLRDKSKTLFTIGYTQTIEDRSQNNISNIITEDLEYAFGRSFLWKKALSASIEYQNENLLQGFLFRFRADYALDNYFYNFALESSIYLTPHIQVYVSGDAPMRLSQSPVRQGTSFISKYKGLSRLLMGGKYVF